MILILNPMNAIYLILIPEVNKAIFEIIYIISTIESTLCVPQTVSLSGLGVMCMCVMCTSMCMCVYVICVVFVNAPTTWCGNVIKKNDWFESIDTIYFW